MIFIYNDTNDKMKLCYYLKGSVLMPNWDLHKNIKLDKFINLGNIKWSNESIEVILLVSKYYNNLLLQGDSFTDKYNDFKYRKNFDTRHLAVLRSQIQKSTRRCKVDIGLKTAISMILIENKEAAVKQVGLFELLRRLTIIMIEDSVLSESYCILMWFMSVISKGHYLNAYSIEKILEITKGILSSGYRDPGAFVNVPLVKINIKENIENPLVMSLLFRSSYKGMIGDQKMLLKAAITWKQRYNKNSKLLDFLTINCAIPIDKYDQLQKTEFQPESLDFHCTNIADRIKKYIDMNKNEIENLIWNNMSSINERINIKNNKINLQQDNLKWKSIKSIYEMEAKNLRFEL